MVKERVKEILAELPPGVQLVGAAKTRSAEEILDAVEGGLENEDLTWGCPSGVVVTNSDGRISLTNTLDARLERVAVCRS